MGHTKENAELRKRHNLELIRRMRQGESLRSFDNFASWYPPRPIIEKDKSAVRRLYGSPAKQKDLPLEGEAKEQASDQNLPKGA